MLYSDTFLKCIIGQENIYQGEQLEQVSLLKPDDLP